MMPGENWVFPKCSTSRKDKGQKMDKSGQKWTKDLIDIIFKYRVKDQSLIKRMQSYKLYIC